MHAIVMAVTAQSAATGVAVRSLRTHHPDARVTVVVTDPTAPQASIEGATTVAGRSLTVGGLRYIDAWLAGGPVFARWALVPAAVRAVRSGAPSDEPILIVPGHSMVFAPIDDLVGGLADDSLALATRIHDEASGVSSGGWVPDLAVVGAGAATDGVLDWWDGLVRRALLETGDAPAVDLDDPWRSFVAAGGPIRTVTDPSVRLSPASIAGLRLDTAGPHAGQHDNPVGGVSVDGCPLRLAQFPSFDPSRPWWYSSSPDEDPPVLASAVPALGRLCRDYAVALADASPTSDAGTAASAPTGVIGLPAGPEFRRAFRTLLAESNEAGGPAPNPLDADGAEVFFAWLRSAEASEETGISTAADIIWRERPDLAAVFPHVRWGDRDRFVQWLWTSGLDEGLITTALLPPLPGTTDDADGPIVSSDDVELRFGVNLVGYHDSDLGLGVAVRRVAAALDEARIPWAKVTYDRTHSRRRSGERTSSDAPYRFNLILIAPDQLQFFIDDVGRDFLDDHYNIGLWYWETDVLNERQQAAIDLVDEIWGSTRYLTDVFAAHSDRPVRHVPVPLEFRPAAPRPEDRQRLGLDDRFTFLFTFDYFSIAQRKNPLGLVTAYRRAFEAGDGCRLILKSINGKRHLAESEELEARVADRPDIEIWDRYLDSDERLALVANVDCYVSLHRSEGLGLTMAEAMAAGTPVIATGYSGNVDFMGGGAGLLVDHELVEIGPGSFYPANGHWAEPDLDHAADLMRQLRNDAGLQAQLRESGPKALRPFTLRRVGAAIRERLEAIDKR